MKQKFENVKGWIRDHKRRTVGIVIAFLLVVGAGVFGAVGVNSVNAQRGFEKTEDTKTVKTAKTEKSETKKETDKKAEEGEQKKEAEDEKVDSTKSTEAQSESTKEQNTGTASTSGTVEKTSKPVSGNGGSQTTTSGTKQPVHTHSYVNPFYKPEQKWVVDQAAWTETVSEPVYEMVEKSICNGCGLDITGDPWTHIENQMISGNLSCGGYHSEWIQVQTGTNTYTVDHPEQGHWESEMVIAGYSCSCGAVQ